MFTPDGNTLVCALQTGEAAGFAEVKTMEEEGQLPLGGQSVSMNLSSDGRLVFCSVQAQNNIFIIRLSDRKIQEGFTAPRGAGPDPFVPLR